MRFVLAFLILAGLGLAGFSAYKHSRPKPVSTLVATLPAPIESAVSWADDLLVSTEAGVFRVELQTGAVHPVFSPSRQRVRDLVAAEDGLCVLTYREDNRSYHVFVVDPMKDDEVIRSFALSGSVVDLPGVLANGRLVVVDGAQVRLVDPQTGRRHARVIITGGILGKAHLAGDRLYVARAYAGGVAIVNTLKVELDEVVEVGEWLIAVEVAGKAAMARIRTGGYVLVDLESGAFEPLDAVDVFVNDRGKGFVLGHEAIDRIDDAGHASQRAGLTDELIAEIESAGGTIVRMQGGEALIACGEKLFHLTAPWKTIKRAS